MRSNPRRSQCPGHLRAGARREVVPFLAGRGLAFGRWHLVAPLMDIVAEKQLAWKSRDAWFCILALIVSQFVILFWLRFTARSSPAFDHWWASSFGTGVIYLVYDALWVLIALWFS